MLGMLYNDRLAREEEDKLRKRLLEEAEDKLKREKVEMEDHYQNQFDKKFRNLTGLQEE